MPIRRKLPISTRNTGLPFGPCRARSSSTILRITYVLDLLIQACHAPTRARAVVATRDAMGSFRCGLHGRAADPRVIDRVANACCIAPRQPAKSCRRLGAE